MAISYHKFRHKIFLQLQKTHENREEAPCAAALANMSQSAAVSL